MPGLGDTRRRSPSNDSLRERCTTALPSLGGTGRRSRNGPLVTHEFVNGLLLTLGIRLLLTGVFVYLVAPDPLLVGLFHLVLSLPRLARRVSADADGQLAGWRGVVAARLSGLQSTRSSRSRSTKERL